MNIRRENARAINDRKTTTIRLNREYAAGDRIEGSGVALTILDVDEVNSLKSLLNLRDDAGHSWWTITGNSGAAQSEHLFATIHPVNTQKR